MNVQPSNVCFEKSFDSWLEIAQKHNSSSVIEQIKQVALESFTKSENEIDLAKLSGINPETVGHAKTNYHAAFLAATCRPKQLLEKWAQETTTAQRSAFLLALISGGSGISDKELYEFMKGVEIKANGGWFQYNNRKTELYNAFVKNRACTPEEFYQKCEALSKVQQSPPSPVTTTTTTTTTSIQAAIPVSKVSTLPKPELQTTYTTFYLNESEDFGNNLDICHFLDSLNKGDFQAVYNQIHKGIHYQAEKKGFVISESFNEVKEYVEVTSLKLWGFLFTAEIKVNKDAIGEKKIKKWGVEKIKAALTKNLNPADLSIKEIVINRDVRDYRSDECFRAADSTVLEKVEEEGVYFYPDEEGKAKALIIRSKGFREILDFSQLDLNMDTQKMLDNINFPKQGFEKMTNIDASNRSGETVVLLSRLKLQKSFKVFNLYCKLQEAKSLAKEIGKDSPRVVAILKE